MDRGALLQSARLPANAPRVHSGGAAAAADDWFTYRCPTVVGVSGFEFADLKWREVEACPDGSIVLGPKLK